MKIIWLLLLVFCSLFSLELIDSKQKYSDFEIEYLYDPKGALSIEDVARLPFQKKISNQFSEGYHEGTAWFKITLVNHSDSAAYILHFTEPLWSKLDCYIFENDLWKKTQSSFKSIIAMILFSSYHSRFRIYRNYFTLPYLFDRLLEKAMYQAKKMGKNQYRMHSI